MIAMYGGSSVRSTIDKLLRRLIRTALDDIGYALGHGLLYYRNRPYPYDVTTNLTLVNGGGPNVFGAYTLLVPIGTYDFNEPPNRIKVHGVILESIPANDTYIIEFASSTDGVIIHQILGAVRFARLGVFVRSFRIDAPCRPFPNDTLALYARLKSGAGGGGNLLLSLALDHYDPPSIRHAPTTGTWPTG